MEDRHALSNMSDVELKVRADGYRGRIWRDWNRFQPGKLNDVWGFCLCLTEAHLRGIGLPVLFPDQLELILDVEGLPPDVSDTL